jgi:hypothetical protein
MEGQLRYLGVERSNVYLTERFANLPDLKVTGPYIHQVPHQLGTIVSQINLMRNWYNSCNEPYAIFCEDDISFETVHYWNFTWDEFMENLPEDWECVQLMRMISPWNEHSHSEINIDLRPGRWWGSHSLMRREYVKRLLDKYCVGVSEYNLEIWIGESGVAPIIENLLFMEIGKVYNIPLLIEDQRFNTTFSEKNIDADDDQVRSHRGILNEWKTKGHTLDIREIMKVVA